MSGTTPTSAEMQAMRRSGALVLAVFALVWAAGGISGIESAALVTVLRTIAVVVSALTIGLALRYGSRSAPNRPQRMMPGWRRRLGLVNVLQTAGIGLAILLLGLLGWQALIPAVVCLVVGVHFLPLARIFDESLYTWTGALLCAVSAAGMAALAVGDGLASRAVVGLGAACVLWAASLWLTLPGLAGSLRTENRQASPHDQS